MYKHQENLSGIENFGMEQFRSLTMFASLVVRLKHRFECFIGLFGGLFLAALVPPTEAYADALAMPSMTAPLSGNADPIDVDGGPLGKAYVSGQITGLGLAQSNPTSSLYSGRSASLLDLGNAQIELQTLNGPVQFYIEAGGYALPILGSSYVRAGRSNSVLFGPVPEAYVKLAPSADVTVQVGALPTLIGAEYTFTFQNMNIERGLLWNQEPAISRGVQINYSHGPVLIQGSVNDGFYSGRYSWVSGLASYALDAANTVAIDGGANLGGAAASSYVTPLAQNNSAIVNVSYTYSRGPATINPYLQYSALGARPALGIDSAARTYSGAILAKYSFTPVFSLAARAEYLNTTAGGCAVGGCSPVNLLYGPGSSAASLTLTPTYQKGVVFVRGELSHTMIAHLVPADGFGSAGTAKAQDRVLIETGVLF